MLLPRPFLSLAWIIKMEHSLGFRFLISCYFQSITDFAVRIILWNHRHWSRLLFCLKIFSGCHSPALDPATIHTASSGEHLSTQWPPYYRRLFFFLKKKLSTHLKDSEKPSFSLLFREWAPSVFLQGQREREIEERKILHQFSADFIAFYYIFIIFFSFKLPVLYGKPTGRGNVFSVKML